MAASSEASEGTKRIAFLTVTLSGHRRLALSLAAEMSALGFPVDFLISAAGVNDELRRLEIDYPDFRLHPIARGTDLISDIDWKKVASSSGRLGGSKLALFECFDEVFDNIEGAVEHWKEMAEVLADRRPDVVVLDHAHKVLQQWAEDNGIPTIVMHTPYFLTGDPTGCAQVSSQDSQRLDEFLAKCNPFKKFEKAKEALGIRGEEISLGEGEEGARQGRGLAPHTLVFCEPELLHVGRLPPRVHAVGPCFSDRDPMAVDLRLRAWLDAAASVKVKVLYVSFGTLANAFLTVGTVGTLLDAFESLGESWRVLWSLPKAQQGLLDQTGRSVDGDRVLVQPFVRQRALLSHPAVQVFMTHAGQSSANEGIAAGCPLVCMPLFCDQYEMAEAVVRHGLGLVFHKDELLDGQAQRLRALIFRADEEPLFRRTARRHAHLMRIRGGCRRAAELIESIAYAGADFGELWEGLGDEATEESAAATHCVDEALPATTALPPARTLLQQPVAMVKNLRAADGKDLADGKSFL